MMRSDGVVFILSRRSINKNILTNGIITKSHTKGPYRKAPSIGSCDQGFGYSSSPETSLFFFLYLFFSSSLGCTLDRSSSSTFLFVSLIVLLSVGRFIIEIVLLTF